MTAAASGSVHRESAHLRNALYPPRRTRASSTPGGEAWRRSHVTLHERMPPRQQCTYTVTWPRGVAAGPRARRDASSARARMRRCIASSLERTARMPSTIAGPRPRLAKHMPTLARSSSVNRGTLTAPGMWPLANSPGDRTSTTTTELASEPSRVAATTSATSAWSSAPPTASSRLMLAANDSIASGVIAESSRESDANASDAESAIAAGAPRAARVAAGTGRVHQPGRERGSSSVNRPGWAGLESRRRRSAAQSAS